jgi:hypothetical protein
VDHDGKVTLTSPYINNIHPTKHKELYSVIPEILQHALPMFERVLSDVLRPLLPMRIATAGVVGGAAKRLLIASGMMVFLIRTLRVKTNTMRIRKNGSGNAGSTPPMRGKCTTEIWRS